MHSFIAYMGIFREIMGLLATLVADKYAGRLSVVMSIVVTELRNLVSQPPERNEETVDMQRLFW